MAIHVSDQQLEEIELGHEPALIVHSKRTRKDYAIISESTYQQVRPLLEIVAMQQDASSSTGVDTSLWTEQKNGRRVELINKKFDSRLTASETQELAELAAEADRFREQQGGGVRTQILELILAGLKQQASNPIPGQVYGQIQLLDQEIY